MIDESAIVSARAEIGKDVSIGPFSRVHDDVVLGDGCSIDAYCELGYPAPGESREPLVLGAGAKVRSHSCFYAGSRFGTGLVTGHRVTVREGIVAGAGLQIGTLADLQGDIRFGDHVRLQSRVLVAQGTEVGNYVWMFPNVVITNDPHPPSNVRSGVVVEDFAVLAAAVVILPGVRIGRDSLVAAGSIVRTDVAVGALVAGNPARYVRAAAATHRRDGSGDPAYPWRRHFQRGYPAEVVNQWRREAES